MRERERKVLIVFNRIRREIRLRNERRMLQDRSRLGAEVADQARVIKQWQVAAEAYQAYLERRPRDTAVALRLAALRLDAGELDAAELVVRRVLEIAPRRSRAHWLLGRILEEDGRTPEAEAAYLDAIAIDRHSDAVAALRRLWRNDAETECTPIAPPTRVVRDLAARWDFVVRASEASPALIRATVLSILALEAVDRRIWVIGRGVDQDAAVESLAFADPRIRFVRESDTAWPSEVERVVSIIAGAVLDADGMEWLYWAYDQQPGLVYGDHDHARRSPQGGLTRSSPVFFPAVDVEDLRHTPEPPIVLVGPAAMLLGVSRHQEGGRTHRAILVAGLAKVSVTHIPVTVASQLAVGDEADLKVVSPLPAPTGYLDGEMLVVVPTRNMGVLCTAMIKSLWRKATQPEALHVLLIDNCSDEAASLIRFSELERCGMCEVLRVDEPFNWARFNNLAAREHSGKILVFANNDMEMLTQGWDERVREGLALDGVGLIGARLLFPSGGVQHAGIALNAKNGEPLHEGLGAAASDLGPSARWTRRRPAAAVTGAFMAVSYDVFKMVGGFDDLRFPVSCNDIDFCLRVRSLGLRVLYDGQLELIHHESLTRGHAETAEKRAWFEEEMASLMALWPEAARCDESRSPRWRRRGLRLFATETALDAEQVQNWVTRTRHTPAGAGSD